MFAKIAAFLSFVRIFGLSENLKIYGGYRNSERRIRISASRLDIAEDLANNLVRANNLRKDDGLTPPRILQRRLKFLNLPLARICR